MVKLYCLAQILFHVSLLPKEEEIGHQFGVDLLVIMVEQKYWLTWNSLSGGVILQNLACNTCSYLTLLLALTFGEHKHFTNVKTAACESHRAG